MSCYVTLPLDVIKPNPRNARTHSKKQIQQIVRSIREFGFATPVLVDESYMLIAGHGRIAAARVLASIGFVRPVRGQEAGVDGS